MFTESLRGRIHDVSNIVELLSSESTGIITIPEKNSNDNEQKNFHLICVKVCGTGFGEKLNHRHKKSGGINPTQPRRIEEKKGTVVRPCAVLIRTNH